MQLLGVTASHGAGARSGGDFESIQTVTVGAGGSSSIDFTSIPATYKHLQVRWIARGSGAGSTYGVYSRVNSDSGSNYNSHFLYGNGSSVGTGAIGTSTSAITGVMSGAGATASAFGSGIIDLLDYANTSKYKTLKTLAGTSTGTRIDFHSGLWMNTAAVTSWSIIPETGNFVQYSTFALYGIKAA